MDIGGIIETICEVIFPLLWFLAIFGIIIKARRKAGKGGSAQSTSHKASAPQVKAQRIPSPSRRSLSGSVPASHKLNGEPVKKAGLLKTASPMMMEDREHDWLAGQLKEEARIMSRGDLLDLGAGHNVICDAHAIKLMHMLQHDNSIDSGEI